MMKEYIMVSIGKGKHVRMTFDNVLDEHRFFVEHLPADRTAYVICRGGLIGAYAMVDGIVTYISYM